MDIQKLLIDFFNRINNDPRVSKSHVSLYSALCFIYANQNFIGPVKAYSKEIMKTAKISSNTTYHLLIRELSVYGYITYKPDYRKDRPSLIYLPDS